MLMKIHKKKRPNIVLLFYILPAFIFYFIIEIIPAAGSLFYSLTDWNGLTHQYQIIGISNYFEALTEDSNFVNSLLFTLKYALFIVVLQNLIALMLAAFIESRRKGRVFFRTVYFMPNMISMIIAGYMWMFIFTRVLPQIAEFLPALGFLDQSWIGDPNFSFPAILIVSLWGGVGYQMIIYIAAIQGVPQQLKEAAIIDGATNVQIFWRVTLPMIMPALTIGIFLALNSSIKVFDVIFVLTGGGPGWKTQPISLNIFEEAFKMNNRYGYACAKAVILFLIVCVITVIQLSVMKKKEVDL